MLRLFGNAEAVAKIAGAELSKTLSFIKRPDRQIELSLEQAGADNIYETIEPPKAAVDTVIELSDDIMQDTAVEIVATARSSAIDRAKTLEAIAQLLEADSYAEETLAPQENDISIEVPLVGLQSSSEGQHWDVANGGTFNVRRHAHDLLDRALPGLPDDCDDVGVVIVDAGLSADYIRGLGGQFGGGWQLVTPGAPSIVGQYSHQHERAVDGHGNMVARNVLAGAPGAVIYDAPLLPKRVSDVEVFSSDAKLLLDAIAFVIKNPNNNPHFPKHKNWIIVNAWGVATSFADAAQPFRYANSRKHRLNASVIRLANMQQVDVVFAAGNSGAFDPARLAGPYDRGHHRSIWGANGLPEVFTIGAIRSDGIGIGASSQGPSQSMLTIDGSMNRKPDFSSPSWFVEDLDQTIVNTGTSAACAVFAGWLAKVRTVYRDASSQELKGALGSANTVTWSPQTGHSISDPSALLDTA